MTKVGGLPGQLGVRLDGGAQKAEKPFQANAASALSAVNAVPVAEGEHDLPPSELVRFAPENVWTDNAKVQFAWDLRDQLLGRIGEKPEGTRSPAEQHLYAQLRRIDAHQVDPRVATEVLVSLARGLSPGQVWLNLEETATKILARSLPQLKLALAELDHPKTLKAERVADKRVKPDETAELGRAIAGELLRKVSAQALDPGSARLAELSGIAPFVWGQLAKEVGAESAEAFFREVAAAEPGQIEDCVSWLAARSVTFESMREAVRLQGAPARSLQDAKASGASVRAWAIDPGTSPRLARELERQTEGLADLFGLDAGALGLQLRARQREACQAAGSVIERAERAFGADRAHAVLARFDLEAEIGAIASLKAGIHVHTDLESPKVVRAKTEAFAARVGEAGLHLVAEDLRGAIQRDGRLGELAATFAAQPKGALHVQAALVGVLQWAMPSKDGETAAAHALRIASTLREPGAMKVVTDRLAAELAVDRDGLVGDLRDRVETSRLLHKGAVEALAQRGALQSKLERGRLPIGREVLDAIEAHMRSCYPQEGMGYLATDGRATYFFPVKNVYAGVGFGRDRGEDDPEDVGRMSSALDALGLDLLAKVHSHPDQSPVFSDTDLEGMRLPVALAPELRTVIVEVSKDAKGELVHRVASFASQPNGQVRAEDRLEVA